MPVGISYSKNIIKLIIQNLGVNADCDKIDTSSKLHDLPTNTNTVQNYRMQQ